MLKTVWYQNRRIQKSIGDPIDLSPAPSARITKRVKSFSESGFKNSVDLGDAGLKWKQRESPDIFLHR
jgi:hypothetical protein